MFEGTNNGVVRQKLYSIRKNNDFFGLSFLMFSKAVIFPFHYYHQSPPCLSRGIKKMNNKNDKCLAIKFGKYQTVEVFLLYSGERAKSMNDLKMCID
jgi:hypothetical protein